MVICVNVSHAWLYIHVVPPSCTFMPLICSLMTYQSCIMASFSVPLLSICRGKLHRQVHVCDLLISYNHSPSTFTAVHPCCIPAACIGSGNETAMEVTLATH